MFKRKGSGILRHQPQHEGFVPAPGHRPEVAEAIDRHIAEHFGPVESVLHEMVSHLIGAHVHLVEPTEQRPFRTLITSGMSERPMTVPDDVSPYAELMLRLPPDWPVTTGDERYSWPITVLKQLARLPHEYHTWIGAWHSVPNGDPAVPYAPGTPFAGVVVTPMLLVEDDAARVIRVPGGPEINLLALIPLHPGEMAVKVRKGTDALIELLDRGGINELIDPARPAQA